MAITGNRLSIQIEPGPEFDRFRALYAPGKMAAIMAEAIRKGMDRANLLVLSTIKRSRFTGNGPFPVAQSKLGHVSRRLIRALTASRAVIADANKLIVNSALGSNVVYFGAHEFGFDGPVSIPAHTREMPETVRTSSGGRSFRVRAHTQQVKSHSRRLRIPERRPLRAGLEESQNQETYLDELYTALADALT